MTFDLTCVFISQIQDRIQVLPIVPIALDGEGMIEEHDAEDARQVKDLQFVRHGDSLVTKYLDRPGHKEYLVESSEYDEEFMEMTSPWRTVENPHFLSRLRMIELGF